MYVGLLEYPNDGIQGRPVIKGQKNHGEIGQIFFYQERQDHNFEGPSSAQLKEVSQIS